MNYISGIIKLIFGFGALVIAVYGLNQYFGGDEKVLNQLEKLKLEGQPAIAEFDTMVMEMRIKRITTYSIGYKFRVNGKTIKDSYGFGDYSDLDSLSGFVMYLPDDPKTNSVNLNFELAKARKEVEDNNSSKDSIWISILLTLFGLFNLYSAYYSFKPRGKQPMNIPPPIPQVPPPFPNKSDFV